MPPSDGKACLRQNLPRGTIKIAATRLPFASPCRSSTTRDSLPFTSVSIFIPLPAGHTARRLPGPGRGGAGHGRRGGFRGHQERAVHGQRRWGCCACCCICLCRCCCHVADATGAAAAVVARSAYRPPLPAVAGEAAGLSLGLLCAGSGTEKAAELLAYAHETQVRGQAVLC